MKKPKPKYHVYIAAFGFHKQLTVDGDPYTEDEAEALALSWLDDFPEDIVMLFTEKEVEDSM